MGKEKLSDVAYEKIKELIKKGVYRPGMALPEIELSERLGISRTPIREALYRLQENREIVEGKVASILCREDVPVKPFQDLVDAYEEARKIPDDKTRHAEYDEINEQYYQTFKAYCENKMLVRLYVSIYEKKNAMIMISHVVPLFRDRSAEERLNIAKAIVAKDKELAESLARERIKKCLERIFQSVART